MLVHTGWDLHWGTDRYLSGQSVPHGRGGRVPASDQGAALVGIDSLNIDDLGDLARPVHSTLLGAGVPIVEHLRGLEQLPAVGRSLLRRAAQGGRLRDLSGAGVRDGRVKGEG